MADFSGRQITVSIDIFESLELIAAKNNMKLDYLVNHVLKGYIDENFISADDVSKNRKFQRKKVIIPALMYEKKDKEDPGRYLPVTVLDISIGGLKLALPPEEQPQIDLVANQAEFEVILYLTDTKSLSRFKCKLIHVQKSEQGVNLGVSFLECDEFSHKQLTAYLRRQ